MNLNYKIYNINDLNSILEKHKNIKFIKQRKKCEYANAPFSFDIESSSFYNSKNEKQAIMYAWGFGIVDRVIIGRTWEEFIHLCNYLVKFYNLSINRRIIVYIHNLEFEFQFFRKYFKRNKIFAMDSRDVLFAITESGIEFRCSYHLSGYSLEKTLEHLSIHKIEKLVGDLDYKLIRHNKTPLKENELNYLRNDVLGLLAYIDEKILEEGNITKIALTQTGEVRKLCKTYCYPKGKKDSNNFWKYRKMISNLTINSVDEYVMMKESFHGGFTHANAWRVGKIYKNVSSYDFTSSYPAVLVAEQYPMGTGEHIKIKSRKHFEEQLNLYCCIFKATFEDLDSIILQEHFLSVSHAFDYEGIVEDNGRIVKAKKISYVLTNIDFEILEKCYKWKSLKVSKFYRYMKGYLPKPLILAILDLYKAKTELKDVKGSEKEYMHSKEKLNSIFGMCVTSIVRDEIIYENDQWEKIEQTPENMITILEKYNKSFNRFLFYLWGVFCTAYACKNLWLGILSLGMDYIYSDTDSLKFLNLEKHQSFFIKYNALERKKLEIALNHHNLDFYLVEPSTIKGKKKLLGEFDYEGEYQMFKTLGAKRYLTYKDEKLKLTCSGVNSKYAIPYMIEKFGSVEEVFNNFKDELEIPKGYTGKMIHTYLDDKQEGMIRDYLGYSCYYKEESSIHLEDTSYNLTMSDKFLDYLLGIWESKK